MHSNFCNNLKCLSCFGMVASTSLYISIKWVFVFFFYLFTESNLLGFLVFFLKVICFQTLNYLFFYFFIPFFSFIFPSYFLCFKFSFNFFKE